MFAVIKTGGKQYKVSQGDKIWVEKLEGAEPGKTISISDVLMVSDGKDIKVGTPALAKALVQMKVVDQIRDKKVIVFKKKRRQNYRRKHGHRQHKTVLMVEGISLDGKVTAAKAEPKAKASAPAKEAQPKKEKAEASSEKAKSTPKAASKKEATEKPKQTESKKK